MSSQEEKDMAEKVYCRNTNREKQNKTIKEARNANNHLLLKPTRQGKTKYRPIHN